MITWAKHTNKVKIDCFASSLFCSCFRFSKQMMWFVIKKIKIGLKIAQDATINKITIYLTTRKCTSLSFVWKISKREKNMEYTDYVCIINACMKKAEMCEWVRGCMARRCSNGVLQYWDVIVYLAFILSALSDLLLFLIFIQPH